MVNWYSIGIKRPHRSERENTMDITTTNPKTGKPQSWEIQIKDFSYIRISEFLDGYSENWNAIPNIHKLTDAIANINKATFHNLDFLPLTEEGATQTKAERNCYSYRGEQKYLNGSRNDKTPDANAFVIRKQSIDFIVKAIGVEYVHIGERRIGFNAWTSNNILTQGQAKTLTEWFGQQIIDAVTPEVLQAVKDEYKAKLIAHVKKDIPKIIGWLNMLEAFKG
jgi:hypothetical protein